MSGENESVMPETPEKQLKKRNVKAEDKFTRLMEKKNSLDTTEDDFEDVKKLRVRRTNSVSTEHVISAEDTKKRRYQPDKPIHKPRDSLLSWSSDFKRYEGIVTWAFIILAIGGTRLLLENVIKYGLRVNPMDWLVLVFEESQKDNYFHTPLWLIAFHLHILFAFQLEKCLAKGQIPSWMGWYVHVGQLLLIMVAPVITFSLWPKFFSLLGRMMICTVHTVMFMKLWSYMQVNHWCRDIRDAKKRTLRGRSHSFRTLTEDKIMNATDAEEYLISSPAFSNEKIVRYPDNLTLGDMYYFLLAPTLCYELNFPRTARIRKWFLIRRAAEVLVLSNLLLGLFQQWMIPSVRNSMKPFGEMDFFRTWERLFKLAIPNHLLWLTWFYMVFHSTLNTTGELMRFADRNFYSDWWNAKDLATFWRLWNLPVHKWAVRHLYVPVVSYGYSKTFAELLVFLLSALFHEYLVSVPLQMHKLFVFLAMLVQIPLIALSAAVANRFGNRWGNVIMWVSLILGQPLGILVYFHDYAINNVDIASLAS
uniref:O-acyltransferase n=1 Tax=Hirondellea gigas TaxID=1518452 RepID=A0A2P2I0I6_9CRUS